MRTHIVIDGVVVNTIVAALAEAEALNPGAICIGGEVGGVGWTWDGEKLSPPAQSPVQVPQSITPRQGRITLSRYGLLEAVDEYFLALDDEEAKIDWQFANEWRRDWQLLIDAAVAFGLTEAQIDEMFIQAALI